VAVPTYVIQPTCLNSRKVRPATSATAGRLAYTVDGRQAVDDDDSDGDKLNNN